MEYRPGGGESVSPSVSHGGAGKSVQEKSGEPTEQGKREWRKIGEVIKEPDR